MSQTPIRTIKKTKKVKTIDFSTVTPTVIETISQRSTKEQRPVSGAAEKTVPIEVGSGPADGSSGPSTEKKTGNFGSASSVVSLDLSEIRPVECSSTEEQEYRQQYLSAMSSSPTTVVATALITPPMSVDTPAQQPVEPIADVQMAPLELDPFDLDVLLGLAPAPQPADIQPADIQPVEPQPMTTVPLPQEITDNDLKLLMGEIESYGSIPTQVQKLESFVFVSFSKNDTKVTIAAPSQGIQHAVSVIVPQIKDLI